MRKVTKITKKRKMSFWLNKCLNIFGELMYLRSWSRIEFSVGLKNWLWKLKGILKVFFLDFKLFERETFEIWVGLSKFFIFFESKIECAQIVFWFLTNGLDMDNFWWSEVCSSRNKLLSFVFNYWMVRSFARLYWL